MRQPPENSSTGRCWAASSKPRPGEDGGGAGGRRVGADGAQAFVDLVEAMGLRGIGLRQEGEALGVALQHGVEQGVVAGGRLLRDGGDAGAGGEADVAAVQRHLAGDGAQQR